MLNWKWYQELERPSRHQYLQILKSPQIAIIYNRSQFFDFCLFSIVSSSNFLTRYGAQKIAQFTADSRPQYNVTMFGLAQVKSWITWLKMAHDFDSAESKKLHLL